MSKYKFDVSLVTSGLSEGVQPSDYLYCEDELFDEVNDTSISSSLEYILANQLPKRIFGRMEAIKE